MNTSMRPWLVAVSVLWLLTSVARCDEASTTVDREAVLAKLRANKVNLLSLTLSSRDGGPAIALGTGENGSPENNATDENLRLIAQLHEVERLLVYGGKFSKEGMSALAALPKLRAIQFFRTEVTSDAFAVLPKLTRLQSLDLGEYAVTDEILSYAGQIKGLKSFGQTTSIATPAGFLRFLNGVESLEQLTLFGDFVDDVCLKRIGHMKEMKRLWTNSKRVTSIGWTHLRGLTRMQDLNLSDTNFGDDDAKVLEEMTELKSLSLNRTKFSDAGMVSLARLTSLHDLGLESTKVTDFGMGAVKGMTDLENLYVGMTEVTAKGLDIVPKKERMSMMRTGKGALTAKQFNEVIQLFPRTQIFDPSGYWTDDRIKAAMKELGKDAPLPKS